MKNKTLYYVIALLVIIVWSTTYVSTKVLLQSLSPVEIMFYRYLIAYAALFVVYPKFHKLGGFREELLFIGAGVFGGTLYFLSENYALKYTTASNVGLLVATAPMLTAIMAHFFTRSEKLNKGLVFGFIVAMLGVFLVIFNGHFVLKLNPLGDMLAIAGAASWAMYSVLIKRIGTRYNGIYITRKIFFYSIVTMLPAVFVTDFRWDLTVLYDGRILANLLFLSIIASSACFLLWNKVIWKIGAVNANNFIYLVPLITMLTSAMILEETITVYALLGGLLIVAGVFISDQTSRMNKRAPEATFTQVYK
ncbi:DMT family transporter [Paenibacillus marinisediminis]